MRFITKFKIRRLAAATLCTAGFLVAGCKDSMEATLSESASAQKPRAYLTFDSFEDFRNTYEKIGNQSLLEQRSWDDAHGVTSLRQLYQQVVAEEAANYEQEEKQYTVDASTVPTHKPSATLAKALKMVIRDEANGGVVLNLFLPKMAAVLNKDGIVCIDKTLYQFTYGATKSTPLTSETDLSKTVSLLYSTEKTNPANRVYVGEVKHTQRPVSTPNARGDFRETFSCESLNGSPANWRLLSYLDEVEYTVVRNNNPNGVTETIRGGAITINIRTLKRGTFGSWYDKDSQEQHLISNNFAFRSGSVLGTPTRAYSDLPGGATGLYNSYANGLTKSFDIQPSSQTSSYNITIFGNEYSDFAGPSGIPPSNMRSATGVKYSATWNAYGCACDITRPFASPY